MQPQPLTWNTPLKAQIPAEGDLSGNLKSRVLSLWGWGGSLELVWTSTPTGVITIYAGNSHKPEGTTVDAWNGTWNSINGLFVPAIVQPAGSAGSLLLDIPVRNGFLYVDYARTSGSGILTGTFQPTYGGLV